MALRIYQFPTSMFCEKVRITLSLKNIPYEIVDARQDDRKALIEFSGQKKVPVLDFNGQPVIDSTVICAFLEEKYPQPSLYPSNPTDKGLCLVLEDWADEILFKSVHMMRSKELPEVQKEGERLLHINLQMLEQWFSGDKEFIFDRITLADIAVFVELHYLYTSVKTEVPAQYRNVHAWMDRVCRTLNLSSLDDIAA